MLHGDASLLTADKSNPQSEYEGWVVSSESCAFKSVSGVLYREVLPGEIVEITKHGPKSVCVVPRPNSAPPAFCIFEYVYFARPDSIFEGKYKGRSDTMFWDVLLSCT